MPRALIDVIAIYAAATMLFDIIILYLMPITLVTPSHALIATSMSFARFFVVRFLITPATSLMPPLRAIMALR